MSTESWGLFFVLVISAICIAAGVPLGPVLFLGLIALLVLAFRSIYFMFYVGVALTPFLGLVLSIPFGENALGLRAFGGSIDIGYAEAILGAVFIAWILKTIFYWLQRHDAGWKPRFDLAGPYAALFFAHVVSVFSPLMPDRVLVAKFSLRPVLWSYLAYVLLPVNLIRSTRRLVALLTTLATVGTLAALMGVVSLFSVDRTSQFIHRAHPLPLFGVSVLGENHNLLAELLVVTALCSWALIYLVKRRRFRRLLMGATTLQFLVCLLTFSRTGWIVLLLQGLFIAFVEYRPALRRLAGRLAAVALLALPLVLLMARVSTSNVATSSNSTRLALLQISMQVFQTSPWIGGGAGTFMDRVGSAFVFRLEYGDPLDAHGFLQKLAAETGIVGLFAFGIVVFSFAGIGDRAWRALPEGPSRHVVLLLFTAAGGEIAYQLFNTNYWTGKMWLPIGIAIAAQHVMRDRAAADV